MKVLTNIGFIISLFIVTATIPLNIIWNTSSTRPIYILILGITIGICTFLWVLSIRSLIKYKKFVQFKEEEYTPLLVNGIDVEAVAEAMAEEKKQ